MNCDQMVMELLRGPQKNPNFLTNPHLVLRFEGPGEEGFGSYLGLPETLNPIKPKPDKP